MNLKVSVLGAGSFGTTMAHVIARNAPTLIWCRRPETAEEINREHTNAGYLPDAPLADSLRATADLEEAVKSADVVVMGVPSHGMRSTLEEVARHIRPWVPVVSLAKGLEPGSHLRMTEVIREVLPDHRAGALTGPNLAREIMAGFAAASVVAFEDVELARQLQSVLHSGVFRVYTNTARDDQRTRIPQSLHAGPLHFMRPRQAQCFDRFPLARQIGIRLIAGPPPAQHTPERTHRPRLAATRFGSSSSSNTAILEPCENRTKYGGVGSAPAVHRFVVSQPTSARTG